jgi:hypothetical protein
MGRKKRPSKSKEADENYFSELIENEGLSTLTTRTLIDNGFTDISSLDLLKHDRSAIKELDLPLAERLRLEQFLRKDASSKSTVPPRQNEPQTISIPGTRDTTLADLMAELSGSQDPHGAHQLKAPVAPQGLPEAQSVPVTTLAQGGLADPQVYLRDQQSLGESVPHYDIVDFVNLVPPLAEEKVLNESSGTQLIMKTAARRPKLENISVEEWCLANMRIMNLIVSNGGYDPSLIKDYMSYTIKICELYKTCYNVSVLQYDREYRYMQSVYKFRWGTDTPHLFHVHLLRKTDRQQRDSGRQNYNTSGFGRGNSAGALGNSQETCRLYNSRGGCRFGSSCKFKHVCNAQGCTQKHPRYIHHEIPSVESPELGPPNFLQNPSVTSPNPSRQ